MIDSITSIFDLKDNEVEYCTEDIKSNVHYFNIRLVNKINILRSSLNLRMDM